MRRQAKKTRIRFRVLWDDPFEYSMIDIEDRIVGPFSKDHVNEHFSNAMENYLPFCAEGLTFVRIR